MDLQTTLISAGTFIGGVIVQKLIEMFLAKKAKAEDQIEEDAKEKIDHLEMSVRSMELSMANLTGKLEMVLPHLNSIGKIQEDMRGFYAWKRETGGPK